MSPIWGVLLFLCVCALIGGVILVLRKLFLDPYLRRRFGDLQTLSVQRQQVESRHYKFLWSFCLSWGLAWLVLASFVVFSLLNSNSMVMRVALILDGIAYGATLVILTLPFWIILRNRSIQSKRAFNAIVCGFGIYTIVSFQAINTTALPWFEKEMLDVLGMINTDLWVPLPLFILCCIVSLFLTYLYWKWWLKGIAAVFGTVPSTNE